jgi:hypothetical protein
MTSRAVSHGMPTRTSFGFSDPDIESASKPRSDSRLARVVSFLHTTYLLVHITYWLAAGSFLMLFPWQSKWENNYLIYRYPSLRPVMSNPFLKGAVLGLGFVNLLIGFQEIAFLRKSHRDSLFR